MQQQLLDMLTGWEGQVEDIGNNNTCYDNIQQYMAVISRNKPVFGKISIKLYPKGISTPVDGVSAEKPVLQQNTSPVYRIFVKQYMTEPASPCFDFMEKWNNNVPMPLRVMTGTIEKETLGMYKMHLKGMAEATCKCMRCGRTLTNPISKKYGIGPECMQKIGFVGIDIDDVDTISKKLVEVEWDGWVIKSAILEKEEV